MLLLPAISLLLADPTACERLELKSTHALTSESEARELLEHAKACEQDRVSLEGFYNLLKPPSLASDQCSSLQEAFHRSRRLVLHSPFNDELRRYNREVRAWSRDEKCPHLHRHLVRRRIIPGAVVSGTSLLVASILTGVAGREARAVEASLPDSIQRSDDVCQLGMTDPAAADQCEHLNKLKVGALVSWGVFSGALATTVVFSILARKTKPTQGFRPRTALGPQRDGVRISLTWRI